MAQTVGSPGLPRRDRRLAGPAVLFLALLLVPAAAPAATRIESQGGQVTAELDGSPVPEVVSAMRRATGVDLVLPASTEGKTVTFSVSRVPIEGFVRRLLQALDLGGFALVYESSGAATRIIVVDRGRPGPPPTAAVPAPPPPPAGPVYIPPTTPPVYIPPTTPPVYIPPREPPVYVPPTTPPVYIPPSTPPVYVPPGPPRQVGQ
jgi:hypothetical protein